MSDESHASDASGAQNVGAGTEEQFGYDQWLANRQAGRTQTQPTDADPDAATSEEEEGSDEQEQGSEVETEVEAEASQDVAEDAEAETDDEVLSQLASMSPEEIEELGKRIKSKVPERIGKAIKQMREWQERAQAAEKQLQTLKKDDLVPETPVTDNPFKDLKTVDELRSEAGNFVAIKKWADTTLDDNEDAMMDDVVATLNGKEFTKREVKKQLRNAEEALNVLLPARHEELQEEVVAQQTEEVLMRHVSDKLSWFSDEDSMQYKEYKKLHDHADMDEIRNSVSPKVRAQLNYLLAHAVNSVVLTQDKKPAPKTTAKKEIKPTPPPNPDSSGKLSPNKNVDADIAGKLKEAMNRFESGQSNEDFLTLRKLQLAQRIK